MSLHVWSWFTRQLADRPQRRRPEVELLETRAVPAAGLARPDYVLVPHGGAAPLAGAGIAGYAPAQIEQAYGLNQVRFSNGTVAGDGSGTTIAIVDAYDDPNLASDLHQFDLAFGLPDPVLTKINQTGGTALPAGDTGWAQETALDVEWAHAIAPKASLLLVEANSASFSDLLTAARTAAGGSGVVAVSMSWGGGEFAGESSYDSTFTTPAGHGGVTFVASSGDAGAPVSYPAASPDVLSVGGTTLTLTAGNAIASESGWADSGGGISAQEAQPAYQKGVVTQSTAYRTNPDVAYDADPNTGLAVYNSYSFPSAPWQEFGGTSDAAPQWAAIVAITDQGRALAGLPALDGATQVLPKIYGLPAADFHDITSGTSTGTPNDTAAAGYDLVTGRGSPVANLLIPDLVGAAANTTSAATHFSVSAPAAGTAGTAFAVTVTALDANNQPVTGFGGTVQLTSSDPAAVLPAAYTFTAADRGVHTFTVTLKTAGGESVGAASGGVTGSATTAVSPAAASKLAFLQPPVGTTPGAVLSPAVRVGVYDAFGNLETGDSTDRVSLALATNPGAATLGGTTSVTVVGGVATFNSLTVSTAGTGYTLRASSGTLTAATSAAFNVTAAGAARLLEGFETADSWYVSGNNYDTAYRSAAAAHDGTYGLDLTGLDWFYRTDAGATVRAGDTLSAWVQFAGTADGRAYLGFGATSAGAWSLVAAPNSNQLLLQSDSGYSTYTTLAATATTFKANHWYRLEVDWGTSGAVVGKVFDGGSSTPMATVKATVAGVTTGGFALRSTGSDKYWDTITDTPGVNTFALSAARAAAPAVSTTSDLESALLEYVAALRRAEHEHDRFLW